VIDLAVAGPEVRPVDVRTPPGVARRERRPRTPFPDTGADELAQEPHSRVPRANDGAAPEDAPRDAPRRDGSRTAGTHIDIVVRGLGATRHAVPCRRRPAGQLVPGATIRAPAHLVTARRTRDTSLARN
jgi:hypothetical protein